MNKKKSSSNSIVYSTNPEYKGFDDELPLQETLPPAKQLLRIKLDTKHRGGKTVTLVENFIGKDDDLELLGKQIKSYCGSGGSVKDGQVIIQGDHRQKILQWLQKNGYKAKI